MWAYAGGRSHQHAVADQADGQALDDERLAGAHGDGGVVGVFRMQLDHVAIAVKTLDGHVIAQAGDNDYLG